MKSINTRLALLSLVLLIGVVVFFMMDGPASRQDSPAPSHTPQQEESPKNSQRIAESGLNRGDPLASASSAVKPDLLLPSQVVGRVFPKVDLDVLAFRLPREKFAVFERARLDFPEIDWTEMEPTHQAFLAKRSQFPLNLNNEQREAYATWLGEVEPVSRELIKLRAEAHGLSAGGMEGGRGYYIDGFRNGAPIYVVTTNVGAATTTGVSYVRWNPSFDPALASNTINGGELYVNVNDNGEIYEHAEFQLPNGGGSRIMVKEVAVGDRNHMTHVTGTIAAWGYNSAVQGMAPRSWIRSLVSQKISGITTYGMATPGQQTADTNPCTGNLQLRSVVGNTSLGTGTPYNRYNSKSASYDSVMRDYPYYMHFNSAGNEGSSGYESISADWKIAKNMITIGNASAATRDVDGVYTGGGVISAYSSRGPTYDGRIAPDFATKGTDVISTVGETGISGPWNGTSMAAPNATGSVALLMDYVRQRLPEQYLRSSTYRALLASTADDRGNPGPDYTYGWGILNIHAAAKIIRKQAENPSLRLFIEDSLAPSQTWTETYTSDGVKPIRVSISWLDPASTNTNPDDRAARLVNDLDVLLIGPGGTEYRPYVMPFTTGQGATPAFDATLYNANAVQGDNTTDPVEQVYIAAPAVGVYTVRVTHKGNLLNNQAQPFSVAVSGADDFDVSMEVARGGSPINVGGANGVNGTTVGTGTQLTYTISNVGGGQLELTTPVTISGQQKCSVTVNTQPSSTVAKGASTNLVATVTPSSGGTWSFNISIANNDPGKTPYHWLVTGVASSPATASFTPVADTFIDDQNTGINYGTETRMDLNNRTSNPNKSIRRGLMRFDLSSIPAGTTLQSAKLDFVQDNGISGSVDIFEATASWWETSASAPPNPGATWSNSNGIYGATSFGTATTGTTAGAAVPTITLNSTGLAKVQSWVNNASGNYGFGITTTNNGNGSANWLALRTREHATTTHHPRLTVTYGSGPVAAPLMIVSGSDGVISSGGTDAIFGTKLDVGVPLTYTIQNLGNANLTLTTPVTASAVSNCTITVDTQPSSSVAPSGSTELLLTVTPTVAGAWSATVSIANNDADKNPYTWTISGTAPKNQATLTLNGLSQFYDGTPRAITATTSPAGLAHSITYDGGTSAPTNAGSYVVVATVTDPKYEGSASGTLVIAYGVSYQGNGNTSGTVPADQTKLLDVNLTLATNSGNLKKADCSFAGWNTLADGSGTPYAAGATYSGNASLVLYAQWALGANGTWIQTAAGPFDWGTSGNWSNGTIAAGADRTAYFTPNITIAQVVNLDTARTIGNITFTDSSSSHNLTISGANILTLARTTGIPVIDVTQSNRTLTISSQISGSDGLQKNGAGTLTLSGTNDYTGVTVINAGTLTRAGGTTGTTVFSGPITLATGGILNYSGGSFTAASDTGVITSGNITLSTGTGSTATIALSGTQTKFTINGTITGQSGVNQTLAIVQGGYTSGVGERQDLLFANTIADGGSGGKLSLLVNFTRASTAGQNAFVNLAGQNTFTGDLTVNNSAQLYGGTSPLGAWVTIGADRNKLLPAGPAGTGYLGAGGVYDGNITINTGNGVNGTGITTLSFLTSANQTLNGVISGAGNLRQDGTGTLTLGNDNNYTGTTAISAGTLEVTKLADGGSNSSIGASTNAAANLLLGNATTLRYTGTGDSTDRGFRINGTLTGHQATLDSSGSGAISFTNTATPEYNTIDQARALNLRGTNTGANSLAANIANNGTGVVSIAKDDIGTWVLGGANAYTGTTTVSAGKLLINGDQSLATGAVNVATGATLGGSGTIGGSTTIAVDGMLEFNLSTIAASHDKLQLATGKTLTFSGASVLTITNSGGEAATGSYVLVTAPGGITGSAPATLNLPAGWAATVSIVGNDLVLNVTTVVSLAIDHFAISTIASPQTVGTAITGITLTAQNSANATATSFTGTVTFGGTAGITGTSANFVNGVLSGVSVTPTTTGTGLTFTVNDGASHTGSATFNVQSAFANWSGGTSATTDSNNDGIANGIAWLLGAANPTVNTTALLPTFATDADYFIYTYRRSDAANTAPGTTIAVQYGSTLESWLTATPQATIIITPTDDFYGAGVDKVEVKISKTLASSGKLFGRLSLQTN